MNVFFGDSLTSGENNKFTGYVEKLNIENCVNNGVSGTCIGDYSLYPVGETNLIQKIFKNKADIKKADKIFLEYGCNDISALCAGYTTFNHIQIDLIKSLDCLKQINEKADIYFILLGSNDVKFSEGQTAYLNSDYLKNADVKIEQQTWLNNYRKFVDFVVKTVPHTLCLAHLLEEDIDVDGMHPNDKGYEKIAHELKGQIKWDNLEMC